MPGPDGWRQAIRLFRFLNHHRPLTCHRIQVAAASGYLVRADSMPIRRPIEAVLHVNRRLFARLAQSLSGFYRLFGSRLEDSPLPFFG
jgi:hypothetical protein